jgi:hypothetical protein
MPLLHLIDDQQNRDGGIRTHGLLLPKQAFYQAELHPVNGGRSISAAWRGSQDILKAFTPKLQETAAACRAPLG